MNHWPFIIASYGLTLGGALALLAASYIGMTRAEARAKDAGVRP